MKTWYIAVCEKCGIAKNIIVNGNWNLMDYPNSADVSKWLSEHYSCELYLIWRDDQLDKFFESGWRRIPTKYHHGNIIPQLSDYEKVSDII